MPSSIGRILAIDYGERRVGLALSDELGMIASGAGTLSNTPSLLQEITDLVASRGVARVVVGLPLTLHGDHGSSANMVTAFVERLTAAIAQPVELVDERFTSSIAERTIREMGVGKKKRRDKGKVDEIAAVILLQGYLDTQAHKAG